MPWKSSAERLVPKTDSRGYSRRFAVITGKLQLHGPVNALAIVNAALDSVRPALEAKNIEIETFFEGLKLITGDGSTAASGLELTFKCCKVHTPSGRS